MTDAKKSESKPAEPKLAENKPSTSVQESTVKKEAEPKPAGRLIDMEEPVTSDALNPAYAPEPDEGVDADEE